MAKQKRPPVPILRIRKGDTSKQIYAKAHRAFTAADLQQFTELDEGIPAKVVLAELEALDKDIANKRRRK